MTGAPRLTEGRTPGLPLIDGSRRECPPKPRGSLPSRCAGSGRLSAHVPVEPADETLRMSSKVVVGPMDQKVTPKLRHERSRLITRLREAIIARRVRKAVGYWNHDGWHSSQPVPEGLLAFTAGFPHPPSLLEALGAATADGRARRYLRSGHTHTSFLGVSYCRFGCEWVEGSRCITDGTWVWPEGLVHYVEVHTFPFLTNS